MIPKNLLAAKHWYYFARFLQFLSQWTIDFSVLYPYFLHNLVERGIKVPIYEYQCGDCEHKLETIQKINEDPLKQCPECGEETLRKLISAVSFRLKGTGWYETDFKDKTKDKDKKNNSSKGAKDNGTDKKDSGAKADKSDKKESTTKSSSSSEAKASSSSE